MRTSAGTSSDTGLAPASCSTTADDLVDHGVLEVVHDLADLRIGVLRQVHAAMIGSLQSEHGRGIADHALGELRGRLPCFPWREVVGELVEFGHGLGEDHRKYRVLGVEVEVEARPRDPGTLADGADREIGERTSPEATRGRRR